MAFPWKSRAVLSTPTVPTEQPLKRICSEYLRLSHLGNYVLLCLPLVCGWLSLTHGSLISPFPILSLALITIFVPKFITVWFQVIQRNVFHGLLVAFLASCFSFSVNFSIIELCNAESSFYMKHFYNWIKVSSLHKRFTVRFSAILVQTLVMIFLL